jgi:hypothetical protein
MPYPRSNTINMPHLSAPTARPSLGPSLASDVGTLKLYFLTLSLIRVHHIDMAKNKVRSPTCKVVFPTIDAVNYHYRLLISPTSVNLASEFLSVYPLYYR